MIRVANTGDIVEINKLGSLLHNNFVNTFHMESELNNESAIILVNDDNGFINGYVYCLQTPDNIDILSIVVDPVYRKRGIATNLIKFLISNYCYQEKTLTLEVNTNNIAGVKLYEKLGFKIVNTRKKYYKDEDAYLMKWGIK